MYPIYVLIALLPPVAMLIVGIWWKVISPQAWREKGLAYRTQLSTKSPGGVGLSPTSTAPGCGCAWA